MGEIFPPISASATVFRIIHLLSMPPLGNQEFVVDGIPFLGDPSGT